MSTPAVITDPMEMLRRNLAALPRPPINPPGLIVPGNINIYDRPIVPNPTREQPDRTSTVRSASFGNDRGEQLIPTVSDRADGMPPHLMGNREALDYAHKYKQDLGTFDTPDHATAYAQSLHEQQSKLTNFGGRTALPSVITPQIKAALNPAMDAPVMPRMAMPSMVPSVGSNPLPLVSRIPTQTESDQGKLNDLVNHGAGVDSIHNGVLHGIAKVGNVFGTAASALFPALRPVLAAIPGTMENFNHHVGMMRATVANDQANDYGAARTQDAQAQAEQRTAAAQRETAKANQLDDPTKAIDPTKTVTTDDGVYQANPLTGHYDIRVGDAKSKPKTPEQTVFDSEIAAGKSPSDALSTVYNSKNVKDATTAQMFANGYRKAHPEANDMDVAQATIRATQTEPKITVINAGAANRAAAVEQKALGSGPSGTVGATGEQYLAGVPTERQQLIKSTAAGDIAIPSASSRAPGAQQLRQDVLQYDPTYTDARYKGKQQFKGSGDADKIVQLATALEHGNRLKQNSERLGFSPALASGLTPTSTAYNEDVTHFTDEVGRLIKGTALTQGEEHENKKGLLSMTHDNRSAAIDEKNRLLAGKVEALFQKYKTATGEDLPVDKFFDKPTQAKLQGLGVVGGPPKAGGGQWNPKTGRYE